MRTVIAGTRGCEDIRLLFAAVASCGWFPTTVLSGCARGADRLGERWAAMFRVPVERFPADWQRDGRRAGVFRNRQMASRADALIALWDGKSPGTEHMIHAAHQEGLCVYVHRYWSA